MQSTVPENIIVRAFGSIQAQTDTALIFDPTLRKVLFGHNVQFRWVCDVRFDDTTGSDAFLLTPPIAGSETTSSDQLPASGAVSSAGDETAASAGSPIKRALASIGTLQSEWTDADGTEDTVKWVQRASVNPGGSLSAPPHSMPIAFGSEPPAVRIAKANAKNISGTSRGMMLRQRLADEAGVPVEGLGDAEEIHTANSTPMSRPHTGTSGGSASVEPTLRCPLQVKTYVQIRIPRGGAAQQVTNKKATTAGGKHQAITQTDEDNTSPIASLPSMTNYIACTTDLALRPLKVKVQLTKKDLTGALTDVLNQDAIFADMTAKDAAEAATGARTANPYAADEEDAAAKTGNSQGSSINPSDNSNSVGAAADEADAICGFAHVRLSFIDLSLAISHIVNVHPDATTVTSSTALVPALSTQDRDRISASALNKDLLKCQFVDIKSIVPAKVLEWSVAPRTITYGCMNLPDLYTHFVHFYSIVAAHLASPEAAAGNTKKVPVRAYRPLQKQLAAHKPSCYRDPISGAYRWDTMTSLSLFHYILGDTNVLPVLSLIFCCRGLEHADFCTNALTTISMRRIYEVLRRHPSIRSVDLSGNTFFESAGDEVLRLLKANRSIVRCNAKQNHFSERLLERIEKQMAVNADALRDDPMNFLSPNYSYLSSSTDIPHEVWMAVHQTWITLIAAPLDAHPKNVEAKDKEALKALGDDELAARKQAIVSDVPSIVAAPLLAESMRHVQIEVLSRLSQDRIVRGIFRDFAAHQGEHLLEVELPTLQEIERKGVAPDGSLGMPRYSRSYAKILVTALNATLHAAGKSTEDRQLAWRDAVRVLQGLGETQFDIGCRPWHIMFANKVFMDWLKSVLGPSLLDPLTQASWAQVLALVSRAVISGTPLPAAA